MTTDEYHNLIAASGGDSEADEQRALIEWAGYKSAEHPALAMLFHVPNGGHRRKRVAARMKALGTRAGVPDLCLPVMRERPGGGAYGCLWIEMKSSAGRLRKTQRQWRDALQKAGHAHAVCRSWIEARDTLLAYLAGCYESGLSASPPAPAAEAEENADLND